MVALGKKEVYEEPHEKDYSPDYQTKEKSNSGNRSGIYESFPLAHNCSKTEFGRIDPMICRSCSDLPSKASRHQWLSKVSAWYTPPSSFLMRRAVLVQPLSPCSFCRKLLLRAPGLPASLPFIVFLRPNLVLVSSTTKHLVNTGTVYCFCAPLED